MKTNTFSNQMMNSMKLLLTAAGIAAALSLQGCGGSGAGAAGIGSSATSNSQTSGAPTADPLSLKVAAIDVLSSQPALDSDGRTSASITVVVKDAGNRALEGATVDIATAADSQTLLEVGSTKSAIDGTVRAVLKSTGKMNRNIILTATVGTIKKTLTIPVSGTSVTVNGPTAIANNGSGKYSISLRDSSGGAIPDSAVTVSSKLGNEISPATLKTDSNGQASFILNITKPGTDAVSVSAGGANNAVNVTVAPAALAFTNVLVNDEVPVSTQKIVVVKLTDTSGVNARPVSVTTTRGSITPANGLLTTNGSGEVSFVVESVNAGPTTLNVTGPSGTTASISVEFVSRVPSVLSLQPSKSLVAANPIGSKANSSLLTASVKDTNGNPVKGVKVNFQAQVDPSSGSIDPPSATTDSAGNATVAFISGPNASGSNGVTVAAAIDQVPTINGIAKMTVTNGEVSVRIGTANLLEVEGDIYGRQLLLTPQGIRFLARRFQCKSCLKPIEKVHGSNRPRVQALFGESQRRS
jgi:Bacterial Ig-like domain (group 1)